MSTTQELEYPYISQDFVFDNLSLATQNSPPANTTADLLMRNGGTGAFEIYDIGSNTITFATGMGQVGLEWAVAGFGDFSSRSGETDMLMRNSGTGAFEVYDISNNTITFATGSCRHGQSGRSGPSRVLVISARALARPTC